MLQYLDNKIYMFFVWKPVYKNLSTRNCEKEETFKTIKESILFAFVGILIFLKFHDQSFHNNLYRDY